MIPDSNLDLYKAMNSVRNRINEYWIPRTSIRIPTIPKFGHLVASPRVILRGEDQSYQQAGEPRQCTNSTEATCILRF